jgi:hypothetical protein
MSNESFEDGNDYQGQADSWTVDLRSEQIGIGTLFGN